MKYVCALIAVEDVLRSRHLYETILGQKVLTDFGENVGFAGGFALHRAGHFRQLIDGREIVQGGNAFELYFEEDDLPGMEAKLKAEGVEFIHGIREQPWRQQVMRFYDYDRHIVEIGERLEHEAYRLSREGLGIPELMKLTYLSREAVAAAIREYSGK